MASNINRSTLKGHFDTGDKPTQQNFHDLVESNLNLTDTSTVAGLTTFTGGIYGGAAKVLAAQGTHTNNTTNGAASATVTIAANTLVAGNAIHIKSYGRVTDNNSTDTLTPKLLFGGVAVGTGAALDVANSDLVRLDAWITVRTIGGTGTYVADGLFETDAAGGTKLLWTKASTAIDTTGALVLAMDFDWSVAHAENIYIQDQFIVTIH
tara:strand:- start:60 stop:686 length:627 start_codon:yes stop_codon:yes gene_type:complete